ncbi:MAG: hypothetical protein U0L79_02445 [Lachnospiraceae bacterium]|nr:hypothetical protein [Lachnospiraceae bacterium]
MRKLNRVLFILVICMCCLAGCGKNGENDKETAIVELNREPSRIETSKYSRDLAYFDEIKVNIIIYLNDESSIFEKNKQYTLTELIALDKANIIINGSSGLYIKEDGRYKLNLSSEAFEGITTDDIYVTVRENDIFLYVPVNSEFADKYEDYETGPVKFVFD